MKRFDDFPDLQEMLHEANICTVDKKNGGPCHGDSGSGLIDTSDPNHKVVVGIASWVYPVIVQHITS